HMTHDDAQDHPGEFSNDWENEGLPEACQASSDVSPRQGSGDREGSLVSRTSFSSNITVPIEDVVERLTALLISEGRAVSENTSTASVIFKRLEQRHTDVKFYRGVIGKILHDLKERVYQLGEQDQAVINALQRLYAIVAKLSCSGLVLVLDSIDDIRSELDAIRLELSRFGMVNNTIDVARDDKKSKDTFLSIHERVNKNCANAKKLFGEYTLRSEQMQKFILDKSHLRLSMDAIARDDSSITYEGEVVAGGEADKVHVKEYVENESGDVQVIATRTILLTHLMRLCENVVRPRYVVPDAKMIVMDPISHMTLEKILRSNVMTNFQKVELALKIAGALALIHKSKIIHRDVRACNVLLTINKDKLKNNQPVCVPKLSGFEICRFLESDLSRGPKLTRMPMNAPEVAMHGTSFNTDVYAFGVLMYEISMGQSPDMAGPHVTNSDRSIWRSMEYGTLSESYSDLMARCLEHDFTLRPNMREVALTLADIAGELSHLQ
ncbi:hypothetical protein BGZ73_003023, partial [Actinomortierella ambigua]